MEIKYPPQQKTKQKKIMGASKLNKLHEFMKYDDLNIAKNMKKTAFILVIY